MPETHSKFLLAKLIQDWTLNVHILTFVSWDFNDSNYIFKIPQTWTKWCSIYEMGFLMHICFGLQPAYTLPNLARSKISITELPLAQMGTKFGLRSLPVEDSWKKCSATYLLDITFLPEKTLSSNTPKCSSSHWKLISVFEVHQPRETLFKSPVTYPGPGKKKKKIRNAASYFLLLAFYAT